MLQLMWAMLFVVASLIGNLLLRPFDTLLLNQIETGSLVVILCTITIGFHYLEYGQESESADAITPTIMLIIINAVWTGYLLLLLSVRAKKWMVGKWKTFQGAEQTSVDRADTDDRDVELKPAGSTLMEPLLT